MRYCEIKDCIRKPIEKAHIKSRGAGGSNRKHNRIDLCVFHHRESPQSFHRLGIWGFAKIHGLIERFEKAYEIEKEIWLKKIKGQIEKKNKKPKRYCPTCRRVWSKGVSHGRRNT